MPYTQIVLPSGRRRRDRVLRALRAAWRDSTALWREFRRPFLVFILAVFGGGLVYGYLHNQFAGIEPPLSLASLPYTMVVLMTLGQPTDVPSQPYLIIFWYLLPAIGLYIVGRGVVDFVRLFFDRSGRRAAWEEAVASTYRNHVIVLGVGHVGLRIIRQLAAMGFDVVGIEVKLKPDVERELAQLGVPVIVADGREASTLEKAQLREARSLVVCTASDQANLEVIMRARDLNPSIRIVVRMWDNQFASQLHRFMGVEAVLSSSELAAPAFAGAAVGVDVTQSLDVNGVSYSMIRLKVEADSFMDNVTVGQLQRDNDMDIVLVERAGRVDVHPPHNLVITAGDTLVIFARHSQIIDLVARKRSSLST